MHNETISGVKRTAAALAASALIAVTTGAQAWEPPPDASAGQVLNEARQDAQEGRLAAAAEKHLWFHEHALTRDPAMVGVRLSFALADWAELARRHPPAMAQLLAVRDRAAALVDAGGRRGEQALSEVIGINRYLRQPESTRDAYARFARRDPVLADRHTVDVLPALIATQEFELASRHLRVEPVLARAEAFYKRMQDAPRQMSEHEKLEMLRSQQRYFDLQLARVVLVLAKTQRDAEAAQALSRGRALLGPDANTHHMTQALHGVTPPDDHRGE